MCEFRHQPFSWGRLYGNVRPSRSRMATTTRRNSAYSADYHEKYATDRIERECILGGKAGFELHECIQEQVKTSYEHHTAYADLKAQTRMANWAALMGVFTFFAMVFTGLGVVFVYRTLKVTREIGEAQVRAYINMDNAVSRGGGCLHIKTIVQNYGQSPASSLHFVVYSQVFSKNGDTDTPKLVSLMKFGGVPVGMSFERDFDCPEILLQDDRVYCFFIGVFARDVFGAELSEIKQYILGFDTALDAQASEAVSAFIPTGIEQIIRDSSWQQIAEKDKPHKKKEQ